MKSERIMNLLVTIPAESRRMNVGKDVIRILGSPAYIAFCRGKIGSLLQLRHVLPNIQCPLRSRTGC